MPETPQSSFSASLIRIHKVFTRALDVILKYGQSFAGQGFPDAETQKGFINYVQSFASLLHAHHTIEDEMVFPYFREKMPDKNFDSLIEQHRWMIPFLDEIKVAIEKADTDFQARDSLDDLIRATTKIHDIWSPHTKTEESYFSSERVNALVNIEEQMRLNQLVAELNQKHSGPDYLVVPFTLYNMSPQDREIMSQGMPPIVTQQLVPIDWKEKWEPMLPFLLD